MLPPNDGSRPTPPSCSACQVTRCERCREQSGSPGGSGSRPASGRWRNSSGTWRGGVAVGRSRLRTPGAMAALERPSTIRQSVRVSAVGAVSRKPAVRCAGSGHRAGQGQPGNRRGGDVFGATRSSGAGALTRCGRGATTGLFRRKAATARGPAVYASATRLPDARLVVESSPTVRTGGRAPVAAQVARMTRPSCRPGTRSRRGSPLSRPGFLVSLYAALRPEAYPVSAAVRRALDELGPAPSSESRRRIESGSRGFLFVNGTRLRLKSTAASFSRAEPAQVFDIGPRWCRVTRSGGRFSACCQA
jgi:hypothetical protein